MKLHIQPKNHKLGNIWNISLPAVETCGGMSAACAGEDGKCYVLKIYKRWPTVLTAHQNTYVGILEALENGDELEVEHIISGIVELTKEERKEFSKLIRTTGEGRRVYSIILYGN